MSSRRRRCWLVGALALLAAGCTSFRRIPPRAVLSHRALEVRFDTPTQVVARSRAGTDVVLRHVLGVAGRPVELRGDTLMLEITRWQGIGILSYETAPIVAALLLSDPHIDFGTRGFSGHRAAAITLGPPVAAFVLLLFLCSKYQCMN